MLKPRSLEPSQFDKLDVTEHLAKLQALERALALVHGLLLRSVQQITPECGSRVNNRGAV